MGSTMSSINQILGLKNASNPRQDAFLRWQCRVRLMVMREAMGQPDDSIMPSLTLLGKNQPMGTIITVMSKHPIHSKTPEMRQIAKSTNDPAMRRDKALRFFSEAYYQKRQEFSDILTSTFSAGSPGAALIRKSEYCQLRFVAYNQEFTLKCKVWKLAKKNPLYQATWWHNHLFNPRLAGDTIILGFEPDWNDSFTPLDVA